MFVCVSVCVDAGVYGVCMECILDGGGKGDEPDAGAKMDKQRSERMCVDKWIANGNVPSKRSYSHRTNNTPQNNTHIEWICCDFIYLSLSLPFPSHRRNAGNKCSCESNRNGGAHARQRECAEDFCLLGEMTWFCCSCCGGRITVLWMFWLFLFVCLFVCWASREE